MIEEVLLQYGCQHSDPDELYSDFFHLGENLIQRTGEYRGDSREFKGNPMIYVNDEEDYKGKMKRYILLEDTLLDQLHDAQTYPSNLINGVTYYGKKKDKEHGDKCFGLIFDLDTVDDSSVANYMFAMQNKVYPDPNYVVISKSGEGLHLYYIFDEPIRLYPKIKIQLKELKYSLIRLMWNPYTSNEKEPQYQSYDQSFMVAGTTEKMKVFKYRSDHWNVNELSEYVHSTFSKEDIWIENRYTLEQAKKKFPEWYEKVIENGETMDGTWTCKRDLYDWWKRQLESGATYGHRFWGIMMLAIYAIKCDIPYEELEKDAYGFMPFMNSLNTSKPFTRHDVASALECYDIQFKHFPINDISRLAAIPIQKNKRNGQKQSDHLEEARAVRDIRQRRNGTKWDDGNGRKSKEKIVRDYAAVHPDHSVTEIARALEISRPTVYKYLGKAEKKMDKEEKEIRVDFITSDGILIERVSDKDKEERLKRMMAYRDMMEKQENKNK